MKSRGENVTGLFLAFYSRLSCRNFASGAVNNLWASFCSRLVHILMFDRQRLLRGAANRST